MRMVTALTTVAYLLFFMPLSDIPEYFDEEARAMNEGHLFFTNAYYAGSFLCIFLTVSAIFLLFSDNIFLRIFNVSVTTYYFIFFFYGTFYYSGWGFQMPTPIIFTALLFVCLTLFSNFLNLYALRDRLRWRRISAVTSIVIPIIVIFVVLLMPSSAGEEWEELVIEAENLYREDRFSEALVAAREAMIIAEREVGPDHADFGLSVNNLATIYLRMRDLDLSESSYKRYLSFCENNYGESSIETATVLRQLGKVNILKGKFDVARECLTRSHSIVKENFEEDHIEFGVSLNNLGILCLNVDDYDKAEKYFERSLAVAKLHNGLYNFTIPDCMNTLATVYHVQGEYKKSEESYKCAYYLWRRDSENNSGKIVDSLMNAGEIYCDDGEYERADEKLIMALPICEKNENRKNLLRCLWLLSRVYKAQLRFAELKVVRQRLDDLGEPKVSPYNRTDIINDSLDEIP